MITGLNLDHETVQEDVNMEVAVSLDWVGVEEQNEVCKTVQEPKRKVQMIKCLVSWQIPRRWWTLESR